MCVMQAIKARSEEEQRRKKKKAAMARPTRANSSPNMDAAARAAQGKQEQLPTAVQGAQAERQQTAGKPVSLLGITITVCMHVISVVIVVMSNSIIIMLTLVIIQAFGSCRSKRAGRGQCPAPRNSSNGFC